MMQSALSMRAYQVNRGTEHLCTMHRRLLLSQTPSFGCMMGAMWSHVKSWLFRFTRDNLEKFVQLCNIVVGASER